MSAPADACARATRPVRVVVVVLNWCNAPDTAACLRSVAAAAAHARHQGVEVVPLLVDNGSPDGSGAQLAAEFPDVHYVQTGTNLGYTGGNNAGFAWARQAGADHVVVLNNDALLEPECLVYLVRAVAARDRIGCVAPKILARTHPDRVWFGGGVLVRLRATGRHWGEGRRDDPAADPPPGVEITFVSGCCFLLTRAALEAVGGFEASYFAYNEDADLSDRLVRAGYRIVYEPRARVLHPESPGRDALSAFEIVQRDRNRRRFARLRLTPTERLVFYSWFYPSRAVLAARYAADRDWPRAHAVVRGATAPLS